MTRGTQRRTAIVTVLASYAVILFFIAVGQLVIEAIGITLHVFEIAGGIVLLLFAISLVIGQDSRRELPKEEYSNVAIYPLAIPATAGPGTMLMAMLLTDNARYGIFQQAQTATPPASFLPSCW